MTAGGPRFRAGVIEGFYGRPWDQAERHQLLGWMKAWGLNTYFYAPKDDLHHRAVWREPYGAAEEGSLRALIEACLASGVAFVYGIAPGLDIRYGEPAEVERICGRFDQLMRAGCVEFALLFDDIPGSIDERALARWGSLAAAQSHVANAVFRWTREQRPDARFLFCPTPYCGRMAAAEVGGAGYLETVGRELDASIDVFWTGPDIVSREISVEHVRGVRAVLRRRPTIWDNLHANDYDGARCFCGPYAGRPRELLDEVAGLLSNPNVELPLNYVPLRTLAWFVDGQRAWDERDAYLSAMEEWRPSFDTIRGATTLANLVQFGDCFYLPWYEGDEGEALIRSAARLVDTAAPSDVAAEYLDRSGRLRAFCAAVTELRDRPLFHAINRRVWALREELDLMDRFAGHVGLGPTTSDFHLPGTYRGGIVARLQRLLVQMPDGTFEAAGDASASGVPADRIRA